MTVPSARRKPDAPSNPFAKRWRWWYAAIADTMIAHPEWDLEQIATHLKKGYSTIQMISSTNLFNDYLAARRAQWQRVHDQALTQKLTAVASAGLDALETKLKTKKDLLPIEQLNAATLGALDRLGFAPKAQPQVTVTNNVQNNTLVQPSASSEALLAARAALRAAEATKTIEPASHSLPKQREFAMLMAESGLELDGEGNLTSDSEDGSSLTIGDGTDVPVTSER
jgi:hypothetical protein